MAKFKMDEGVRSGMVADLTKMWFDKRVQNQDVPAKKAAAEIREFVDALCEETSATDKS